MGCLSVSHSPDPTHCLPTPLPPLSPPPVPRTQLLHPSFTPPHNLVPQTYNATWPGSPALDPAAYTSCFAASLDGFVAVRNATTIRFYTPTPETMFFNKYRRDKRE